MKQKLLVIAVLASLMLGGCGGGGSGGGGSGGGSGSNTSGSTSTGGGGGSTSSGGSAGSTAGKQLWMPYDTETPSATTGQVSSITPIILNNMDNPGASNITLTGTPMVAGGSGLNGSDTQTTQAFSSSNGSYQPQGSPLLFYAAAGSVYSVDLTASTPSAVPMANLGLAQLCGMSAEQSDTTGVNGTLLVYGLTGSSGTCGGAGMQTWAIPFSASNTAALSPLAFSPMVIDSVTANGSVAYWLTQVGTNFYVTNNLSQQGTQVTGLGSGVSSLSLVLSTSSMIYVQGYNATSGTLTLYAINASTGVATAVTGIPSASSLTSAAGPSTDSQGNMYFLDETNLANGSLAIDEIPANATSAQQRVTVTGVTTVASGTVYPLQFQVNSQGTGGLLAYVSSNGGTSGTPSYNLDFVNFSTASQSVTPILPNSYEGLSINGVGSDGSMVVQGYSTSTVSATSSTTNSDIYLVNPGTGAVANKFLGNFIVGDVVGSMSQSSTGAVVQLPVLTLLFLTPGPVTTTTSSSGSTTSVACTVGTTNASGISSVSMVETTAGYPAAGSVLMSGSGVCAVTVAAQANPAGSLYIAGMPMTYSGSTPDWSLFAQAGSGAQASILSSVTSPIIINSPGNGGSFGF